MEETTRRVVITGIGAVSPLGSSKEALWNALCARTSGVKPICGALGGLVRFGAPAEQFDGRVDDFGPLDKEQKKAIRKGLKVMCRECQMGVAAAQLALSDAGLSPERLDPERTGISFGADHMMTVPEEFTEAVRRCVDGEGRFEFSRWISDGMPQMSPLWLLKYLPNMPASHLAIYNDLRGPNNSLTLREAAANAAAAEAAQIIRRGQADVMLVGATGTRLHPLKTIHALQQEELADPNEEPARASRPFDRGRTGMVLGEGAGAVVLEELRMAQGRGVTIYGEVLAGTTSSAAARHLVAQRAKAGINVLQFLIRRAAVDPQQLGHVHAHGLGTRSSDSEEAQAISRLAAGRSQPLPVVAAKSFTGNLGAGSGMVELIASLLALQHGRLFPVLNYEEPDPGCPVAAVVDGATPAGQSFVNLSFTPQGQASGLLVGRLG